MLVAAKAAPCLMGFVNGERKTGTDAGRMGEGLKRRDKKKPCRRPRAGSSVPVGAGSIPWAIYSSNEEMTCRPVEFPLLDAAYFDRHPFGSRKRFDMVSA
ncbi:hypothetical protein PMIN06_003896 [Paraphaeosphaeria minitans]